MFTILNFRIWITLLLASSILGCGGGGTAAPAPGDSGAAETVAESPAALTTGWPTPARITAAAGEHLPEQPGAGFDATLPWSNCTPATGKATFDPAWTDGARQLSNAAYALYRLQLNPAGPGATLYLEWAGVAPSSGDCWLGLADMTRNRWQWVSLPQSGEVVLTNPADYAGAGNAAFVAVLLLGDTPAELVRIGYGADSPELTYPIVDTMQNTSHDDTGMQITPESGEAFYGQDAQYNGNQASYTDNGDGTITDNVTGLMWAKTPNNMEKCTFSEAFC